MSGSFPFFRPLKAQLLHQSIRLLDPSFLLLLCSLLTVTYPLPTEVKEVCVYSFYFLSIPRDFPTLLPPASPFYHQHNPLLSFPLILMYKINHKTDIIQSIFSTYWDFVPSKCQFGSNQLIKILYRFGCFLYWQFHFCVCGGGFFSRNEHCTFSGQALL